MREQGSQRPPAWYVISLRPLGQHDAVRRAAARAGMGCVAVSTMQIVAREDAATRRALRAALSAPRVVFTSPNAVRAAAAMATLRNKRTQQVYAIGEGTAAALRRAGLIEVHVPERADSEALLAMAGLRDVAGTIVGLVTAPGGRDRIAPGLRARRAVVVRADVYARAPIVPAPRAFSALRAARGRWAIALSSGEALRTLMDHAPADLAPKLRAARILAGSARLAGEARALGFTDLRIAAGARPAALIAAHRVAARDGRPRRPIR